MNKKGPQEYPAQESTDLNKQNL